jgi:hypothetical protein
MQALFAWGFALVLHPASISIGRIKHFVRKMSLQPLKYSYAVIREQAEATAQNHGQAPGGACARGRRFQRRIYEAKAYCHAEKIISRTDIVRKASGFS